MEKNARPQKTEASALNSANFSTDNPRHLRVIAAALRRSLPRKQVDREAGCSNGPQLISDLRDLGLEFPCVKIDAIDRDGRPCKPGVYNLTDKDRRIIAKWLRNRKGS